MQRNRRPLNPEHQQTHLPMGGMIRSRMKRLFAILGTLLLVQVLIIWAVEDLSLFEAGRFLAHVKLFFVKSSQRLDAPMKEYGRTDPTPHAFPDS